MSKLSIIRRQILILLLIAIVMVSTTACASRQIELQEPPIQRNSTSNDTTDAESTTTTDPISDHQTNKDSQGTEDKNTSSSNKNDKESDEVEDEPKKSELGMHTEIKTFAEVDGKTLTLSVDLPSIWSLTSSDEEIPHQYNLDDKNGTKMGVTFGIIKFVENNENLYNVQIPPDYFLSIIETSEIITIDNREYLLQTMNLSDKRRGYIIAYSYCFIQDGALIHFGFFNEGDKKENIEIYEEVLKSIKVTIAPEEKTASENDYSQYNYLVEPIIHSNILSYTFSCKDNPPPFGSVMWYYLWQAFGGNWEYREYQIPNYIAQENVESILMKHFDLTPEQIRSNTTAYSEKEKGYRDPEGVGGGGLTFKITQVQENQDLLILTIEIFNADGFKQGISILTIKMEGDNWIYLSNEASSV